MREKMNEVADRILKIGIGIPEIDYVFKGDGPYENHYIIIFVTGDGVVIPYSATSGEDAWWLEDSDVNDLGSMELGSDIGVGGLPSHIEEIIYQWLSSGS